MNEQNHSSLFRIGIIGRMIATLDYLMPVLVVLFGAIGLSRLAG